jgi:hypothetical protein
MLWRCGRRSDGAQKELDFSEQNFVKGNKAFGLLK